jgi:hypothetical protein
VQRDVARRLGRSPFGEQADRAVEIVVAHDGTLWKADIALKTSDGVSLGSRSVTSSAPSCESLAAAAALAVALLIDPEAMLRPAASPAAQEPAAESEPAAPAAVTAAAAERRGPAGALGLKAVGAFGLLPQAAPGLALAGEAALIARLRLSVSATFLPERAAETELAEVRFGKSWLAVGPCYVRELQGSWLIAGCASFLLGATHTVVADPVPVEVGEQLWWGVSGGLRLGWSPLGPFELQLGADLVVPMARRNNLLERPSPQPAALLFRESPVSGLVFFGPGVRF